MSLASLTASDIRALIELARRGGGSLSNTNVADVYTDYGADPTGVKDAYEPIMGAILDMDAKGGGTVLVPPGTYTLSKPLGITDRYLEHVHLTSWSYRGVRYTFGDGALDPEGKPWIGGAYLRCTNNTPVITGMWENCRISNLAMDADMRGSPCIRAHFSKSTIDFCEFVGWSGIAVWFNEGEFTDDLGFLNRFMYNNISDTGEEVGHALQLEYRFIDSWVMYNNLESRGTNVVIKSGGPFRIIGNHMNGNRSPEHNIWFDGGVRECIITNNILEGPRKESILYTAPSWLTAPERASITVDGNIIRQASQDGPYPIFRFDGTSPNPGFYAEGLLINNNVISTDFEPTHVVEVNNFRDISMMGNYWRYGHNPSLDPVKLTDCVNYEVLGNHGDNNILGG